MNRRELLAWIILVLGLFVGLSQMASADVEDEVAKWLLGTWRGTWEHADGRPGGSFTLKVVPPDESDNGYIFCHAVAIFEPSPLGNSKQYRVASDSNANRTAVYDGGKSMSLQKHNPDGQFFMRFTPTDRFGGEGTVVIRIPGEDRGFTVAAEKQ